MFAKSNSAVYFKKAETITRRTGHSVKMQVFQRTENAVLCGINAVVGLFDEVPGRDQLKIMALKDGDIINPWEPVMTIEGPYYLFAAYESMYLGILARCTRVATNTRRVVEAAAGKPILFFADRFDSPDNQFYDGMAAAIGGASAVCTENMELGASLTDNPIKAIGTMPHALIAYHDGDVVEACRSYRESFPGSPLVALVDFNNDCVTDSLRCLEAFGKDLKGVRLDTSGNMVDKGLLLPVNRAPSIMKEFHGVNKHLVHAVRRNLDAHGGQHVEIICSGGFNVPRITSFVEDGVPADKFAVGSSLLKNPIDFTADLVRPCSKVGRSEQPTDRLTEVQ